MVSEQLLLPISVIFAQTNKKSDCDLLIKSDLALTKIEFVAISQPSCICCSAKSKYRILPSMPNRKQTKKKNGDCNATTTKTYIQFAHNYAYSAKSNNKIRKTKKIKSFYACIIH